MGDVRDLVPRKQFWGVQTSLQSVRRAVSDNRCVRFVHRVVSVVRERWEALCFTRRFYTQACRTDVAAYPSEFNPNLQDLTECLLQRSVSPKLHALVQLRIASQIASIAETTARAEVCRSRGWSDDQIRAVMASHADAIFSEPEMLVLRYADEITRTPIDVDPQTVRQLRRHFNRADLLELAASIAHENFRCRFQDANSKVR